MDDKNADSSRRVGGHKLLHGKLQRGARVVDLIHDQDTPATDECTEAARRLVEPLLAEDLLVGGPGRVVVELEGDGEDGQVYLMGRERRAVSTMPGCRCVAC